MFARPGFRHPAVAGSRFRGSFGVTGLRIAILAAGASARMRGRDKLLEEVEGLSLLRLAATRALATGCRVLVTLPVPAPLRAAALGGLAVDLVPVADAGTGMAASFRALARTATGPLLVTLADMPEIDTPALCRLIAAHRAAPDLVLRATASDGTPGQPVLFPARLVPAMAGLTGDTGARALLTGEKVRAVPLPGRAAVTDLDTPEDWAAWRAGRRPEGG